jgi:hypothetical protein
MADLAKNTMQLSILLSLIHLRGESLPERRTELYDTYIDVFFNRESEKSNIVKKHRDLLIDIHRYLGFYLHAKAESGGTTGRISVDELKDVVSAYLQDEGRPVDTLDDLLTGMVERVVAIVSRVEGTYEFEVQPLREYFAARHLYNTASYSPPGRERTGTKPDRFDGIAPNPYWLNVTRFYAGCYSKGELLDLADRICELVAAPDMLSQTYPRRLGVALLQDWVFNQSPKATKRAVEGIFDSFGLRWAVIEWASHGTTGSMGDVDLHLREATGAQSLLTSAWARLLKLPHTEAAADLCEYIGALDFSASIRTLWRDELTRRDGDRRDQWIETGAWLGAYLEDSPDQLLELLDQQKETGREYRFATIARSGVRFTGFSKEIISQLAYEILNRPARPRANNQILSSPIRSRLGLLDLITAPGLWQGVSTGYYDVALQPFLNFQLELVGAPESDQLATTDDMAMAISNAMHETTSLGVWRHATSGLRSAFGKSWAEIEIAVMSGRLHKVESSYVRADGLFSDQWPMPDRIRSARRRAGRHDWWLQAFDECSDEYDYALWALAVFAWATPATFAVVVNEFDKAVGMLSPSLQESLIRGCGRARSYSPHARRVGIRRTEIANFHPETLCALFNGLERPTRAIVNDRLKSNISSPIVAEIVLGFTQAEIREGELRDDEGMSLVRQCLKAGGSFGVSLRNSGARGAQRLSESWAKRIMDDAWEIPAELAALAIRAAGNKEPAGLSVWQIAEEERWFED